MIGLACVCACIESFNLQRKLKLRNEISKRPSQPLDNGRGGKGMMSACASKGPHGPGHSQNIAVSLVL